VALNPNAAVMTDNPNWADSLYSAILRRYGPQSCEMVTSPYSDRELVKIHTDRLVDILYMRTDIYTIKTLRRGLYPTGLLWVSHANIAKTK